MLNTYNPKIPIVIYVVPVYQYGYNPTFDPAIEFLTTYKNKTIFHIQLMKLMK